MEVQGGDVMITIPASLLEAQTVIEMWRRTLQRGAFPLSVAKYELSPLDQQCIPWWPHHPE
jgi:hypothetical protein